MTQEFHLDEDDVARILRALEALTAEPGTGHLGDLALLDVALNELDSSDRHRVESHLAECAACRAEISSMREEAGVFETDAGRQQLERMWSAFLSVARAREDVAAAEGLNENSSFAHEPVEGLEYALIPPMRSGAKAAARGLITVPTPSGDQRLEWQLDELENGTLEGVFTSISPYLADARVLLNSEPPREIVVSEVARGSWEGRFIMPADAWITRRGSRLVSKITLAKRQANESAE